MNYNLHENGWTVFADCDLRTCNRDDINHTARLLATNTIVVFRNQKLSVEDELRVIHMFKNAESFFESTDDDYSHCHVKGANGVITRVTGEKDEDGFEGLAGFEEELVWHCNFPGRADRRPLVWLYGVRGTAGSRTSWNNNILSYNDLPTDEKEFLKTIKAHIIGSLDLNQATIETTTKHRSEYLPNIVQTNNAGKTGLFFPFYQISHLDGMSPEESRQLIDRLAAYTTQEKYCYHHDWQDGDLVISEQWLGIHKRWPFKDIRTRLLHRAAFDFPDQDYSQI